MSVSEDQKQAGKLQKLMEIEGFANLEEMLRSATFDSTSPAICMNEWCDYTCQMEPDQTRGWCEACSTNSVKSALILAGLI